MADETVDITRRWLDLIEGKIGSAKVERVSLRLSDGRKLRLRPGEILEFYDPEEALEVRVWQMKEPP